MTALLLTLACGGSAPPLADATAANPAAAAPGPATPATPATPAAAVGPDGPEDIKVVAIAAVATDAATIGAGEKAWNARGCGGCHKFGEKLVGPDLKGVLTRRSTLWVERIIADPERMTRDDPVAKELFRTLMVQMPKQGVTDAEMPALLAYVKSQGG
jgi:hypothetical protein